MEAMIHLFTALLLTIAHSPGNADLERESLPAEERIVAPSLDPGRRSSPAPRVGW